MNVDGINNITILGALCLQIGSKGIVNIIGGCLCIKYERINTIKNAKYCLLSVGISQIAAVIISMTFLVVISMYIYIYIYIYIYRHNRRVLAITTRLYIRCIWYIYLLYILSPTFAKEFFA